MNGTGVLKLADVCASCSGGAWDSSEDEVADVDAAGEGGGTSLFEAAPPGFEFEAWAGSFG